MSVLLLQIEEFGSLVDIYERIEIVVGSVAVNSARVSAGEESQTTQIRLFDHRRLDVNPILSNGVLLQVSRVSHPQCGIVHKRKSLYVTVPKHLNLREAAVG